MNGLSSLKTMALHYSNGACAREPRASRLLLGASSSKRVRVRASSLVVTSAVVIVCVYWLHIYSNE